MTESFLHYIWQFQYFNKTALCTTTGEEILVFDPGQRNPHSGPDFFNARLKIADIEWVGSVEIHIYASGWMEHHHNLDAAYENVILHVVWKDDKPISRMDGALLPALELKSRVDENLLLHYKRLVYNPETIPCAAQLSTVKSLIKFSMLDKVLVERLEAKAGDVLKLLHRNGNDWEETVYQLLMRNFGFKVNSDPFQQLAQSISFKFLLRHADQLVQLEALLFGQAGFLEDVKQEPYYQLLQREYRLLSQKYQVAGRKVNKAQWRFLRLRPANFPSLRIAQFAAFVHYRRNFFSSLLDNDSAKPLRQLFSVTQSAYWMRHYQFFKPQDEDVSTLGDGSIDNIIMNTVVPVLAAYGKSKDDQVYIDRAIRILQDVHAESNMITNQWKSVAMPVKTAFDSQALVQLYNNYCLKRRCLECSIGISLLNSRPR